MMQMNEWRAQLARLRNLALRATPGPWADGFDVEETLGRRHDCNQGAVYMNYRDRGPCPRVEVWLDTENARQTEIDAAFIVAANPAMVLELLNEIERLKYELETAKMMLARQKKEGPTDKLEQTCAVVHSPCDNGGSNADENSKSMTSGLRKATGGESK